MGNYNPCVDIRAASHAMRRRFDSLDIGKPSGLTPRITAADPYIRRI